MPHDKNGVPLAVGDTVTITGRVKEIQPQDTYCNASVELDPMPPYTTPYVLSLNTNQMVIAAPRPAPDSVPEPTHQVIEGGGTPGLDPEP